MDAKPGVWQGIAVVSLIIAVIALVMPFVVPAPAGPAGPEGSSGTDGADGIDGTDGTDGTDGLACWDLNASGTKDLPEEDINGDSYVDVNDCTGLQGPQGPEGPPGPGSLMAFSLIYTDTTLTDTCAAFTDAEVSITVPGPGRVLVTAQVRLDIYHTQGTADFWRLFLSNTPANCNNNAWALASEIPSTWGDDVSATQNSLQKVFNTPTAGTYTYYINGYMVLGSGDGDIHQLSNMVVIFFPS